MAISFNGEFHTTRCLEEVYAFLCDPHKFGPLFPDFESMTVEDATHFTLKLRVGVGKLRGTAELKMELAEASSPQRALYKGRGIAVGSQIAIGTGFVLSPVPEGTRVAWRGEASVFGKLAAMAGGMLEPVAQQNIHKLIDGLRWALSVPVVRPGVAAVAQEVEAAPAVEESSPDSSSVAGAVGEILWQSAEGPESRILDAEAPRDDKNKG
jgi:uncharacterized protein